ncbi:MAG: hypothetical protein R3A13_07290, partial [Bdellovibrionota bacterium]
MNQKSKYLPTPLALTLCFSILYFLLIISCVPLNFDGASAAQGAINFFKNGSLELNYRASVELTIGLPFEILNGFFLMLGRSMLYTNLANLVFFSTIILICFKLATKSNSKLPYLSYLVVCLSPLTVKYAFAGYGEVPALVFCILGAFFYLNITRLKKTVFGGVLFGLGVATKLVVLITLPALLLAALIHKKSFRSLLIFTATLTTSSLIVLALHYGLLANFSLSQFLAAVIEQTNPLINHNREISSGFFLGFQSHWNSYVISSGGEFVALLKLLLLFPLLATMINSNKESKNAFPAFLILATCIYFIWYFFFSMRVWERRFLNADILLYLSLGSIVFFTAKRSVLHLAYTAALIFLAVINLNLAISYSKPCLKCSVSCQE